jgi:hypothetical protein
MDREQAIKVGLNPRAHATSTLHNALESLNRQEDWDHPTIVAARCNIEGRLTNLCKGIR